MKFFPLLAILLFFASCSKDKLNCVARDAQGDPMYEVVGSDVCEEQISSENGETCDCEG